MISTMSAMINFSVASATLFDVLWDVSLHLSYTQFEFNFASRQWDTSTRAEEGLGLILVHHPMIYVTLDGVC